MSRLSGLADRARHHRSRATGGLGRLVGSLGAVLVAIVVAVGTSGCHLSPYAATVNNQVISQQALDTELHAIADNAAYVHSLESSGQGVRVQGAGTASFDTHFADAVLNRQILFALVHQAVVRRGIPVTSHDLALARADVASSVGGPTVLNAFPRAYQADLVRHSAEVTALEASLAHVSVGPTALRRYYDSHRAQFRSVCVSLVLVKTVAKADQVEGLLRGGAAFAKVAGSFSQDAATKASGGTAGCALPQAFDNQYGPPLGAALAHLKVGALAPPVKTPSGWVVAKVTKATQVPFSRATSSIRSMLLQGSSGKVNAYLQRLVGQATIKVDPRYGHFVVHGPSAGLRAPSGPPAKVLALPNGMAATGPGGTP
ncbi:MAG TPA: peptidyl-prolyl cis-trans isomerase [Acidimicrobiales bacterium]|nr:peptidyl-prolyl cis-trans isomerase [Acidimicrobiales bacterium]